MSEFNIKIDHLAIVVKNLEKAIQHYEALGFQVIQNIETKPDTPQVLSAIVALGELRFVLLQPNDPESPLSKYRNSYGEGVHHIAINVDDVRKYHKSLTEKGFGFGTPVITAQGLQQVLTQRCENSGIMLEFTGRAPEKEGLDDDNFDGLLVELQKNNHF